MVRAAQLCTFLSDSRARATAQVAFLAAFLANKQLKEYVRTGQLEIVLWEHLGECVGPPHMRCWQPLVYSHAILEAWGCNTYLLISDSDEYFVLPKSNSTLAEALSCTQNKPMVRLPSRCKPVLKVLRRGAGACDALHLQKTLVRFNNTSHTGTT